MIKKALIMTLFVLATYSLAAQQLMHFYYKDYQEISRLVFVFDSSLFFKVNMDTDNQFIDIELSHCKKLASMLPVQMNQNNLLIDHISISPKGKDLNIRINTKKNFYGEMFTIKNENFKLVLDIYNSEEPDNIESAKIYLDFYQKVSLFNRANAMKKRINKNDFPKKQNKAITPISTKSNEMIPVEPEKDIVDKEPQALLPKIKHSNDLFQLMMPAIAPTHPNYQWIKDAFEIHRDLRKIMMEDYETARLTLNQYREAIKVDVSFLEKLSAEHNQIAKHPVSLNAIKLRAEKQLNNAPSQKNAEVRYTLTMLNTLIAYMPELQKNNSCSELSIKPA
nr:hypothetical protein [Candidatus Cloacimonadota bacterium]